MACYNWGMEKFRRALASLSQKLPFLGNKYVRSVLLLMVLVAGSIAIGFGYAWATTPGSIQKPRFEHAHFRMQILVDGKAVNFAEAKYQEGYAKDNCNADITLHPIHFHDSKDQFVHIHWREMTGGQVLKYYGWNYIGGVHGMLGYRFDSFPNLRTVPIHGDVLPQVSKGATMYVYTGDESGYKKRSFDDFKTQDLEQFFGAKSNVPREDSLSMLDRLFPTASAHGTEGHGTHGAASQEDLKRINNLIGNVVIFVQDHEPSDSQVKQHFQKLEPLSDSACAG